MKKLVWAELARRELEAAADHYFNLEPGLENRFLDDADSTIDRIKKSPLTWKRNSASTRAINLSVFPYSIIYRERDTAIQIIAITHQRQKPFYWIDRLKK
jgi:plasmid stabilization system protein ParE